MASAGPNSPGTLADDSSFGSVAWTNPSNAGTSDNSYATYNSPGGTDSHYLKATNFGFSIPSDATITNIKVEIERKQDNTFAGDTVDSVVKLVVGGAVTGNNKASGASWPAPFGGGMGTDAYASYDYSVTTWGVTPSPSDVNASNFGVVLAANAAGGLGANPTAYVDHVRITVTYTQPGQAPGAASMLMAL